MTDAEEPPDAVEPAAAAARRAGRRPGPAGPRRPAHPHGRLGRHRGRDRDPRPRRRPAGRSTSSPSPTTSASMPPWPPGRWRRTAACALEVVVGEEVTTLGGHLLALYLEAPVRSYRSLRSTIAAVHDAGGIAIPAHPLVPYPLCAQAFALRRLLEDPDPRVPPRRDRDAQPHRPRPAAPPDGRPLRRRARPAPRRQQRRPRPRRHRARLDVVRGADAPRTCGRRSPRARPSITARSTAPPASSGRSGSSCASGGATPATS